MNDAELRAAAEEVARALGLNVEGYVCPWCGFNPGRATPEKHYEQDTCPTCQFSVEYETRPLDLLADEGYAALSQAILHKYDWQIALTHDRTGTSLSIIDVAGRHLVRASASTASAALVQAAHAALRAGWLEGEGNDAE